MVLAADKRLLISAMLIIPQIMPDDVVFQAVLLPIMIVWLSRCPICEFPGSVIRPLPDALLLDVRASKPSIVQASSHQLVYHIVLNGICVGRRQVSELLLAKLLSVSPALRVGAKVVAVVSKNLPAFVAVARPLAFAILAEETLLRNRLESELFKSVICRESQIQAKAKEMQATRKQITKQVSPSVLGMDLAILGMDLET